MAPQSKAPQPPPPLWTLSTRQALYRQPHSEAVEAVDISVSTPGLVFAFPFFLEICVGVGECMLPSWRGLSRVEGGGHSREHSGRRARVWLGLGKRTSGLGTLTPAVFQLRELVHITPPELGSLHGEPAHHLCPDSMPGPHSEGSSQAGVLLPWVFLWLRSGGCGGWRLGWALGRCL